ncbi:16426_t:CDS:2 [Dentiscutata erythropus]|uniref:16426_t:CDS:1 n=1 Tax=Dentiscutata erythropus TaxID=1348616 RepID=A0A9N9FPK0_9GLOM|nr:16426_t:CDS:2 [Dentiscutata erythropus]
MSLVSLLCWECGVASWFFVGGLVASFVTSRMASIDAFAFRR